MLRIELAVVLLLWAALAQAQPSHPPPIVAPLEANEEIVSVETRPGVSVRMVLVKPEGEPKGIFPLYPGGLGRVITSGGHIIRAAFGRSSARHFPAHGFIAAIVDVPSDEVRGLDDVMRLDGPRLGDPRLRGIVLAGSKAVSGGGHRFRDLYFLPLGRIKLPVLIVHHENDGCLWTSFQGAQRLPKRFESSSKVDFLPVQGGHPPLSPNACDGSWTPHDFFGKEAEVVAAAIAWATGAAVPERIVA